MKAAWHDYQEQAADFFRELGLSAQTNVPVIGARGGNNIDVVVEGKAGGIPFKWLIECKHWKSNVTKEKAQAFLTVVQNVGADRGFLLSEKGFQSGAVDVTRNTNVHLGSIAGLRDDTNGWAQNQLIRRWRERKNDLVRILNRMHRLDGGYFTKYSDAMGSIFGLDPIIDEGTRGEFPVPFSPHESAADWDELVRKVESKLADAESMAGLTPQPFLTDPFGISRNE